MKKICQFALVLCVVLLFSACTSKEKQYADAVHEVDLMFGARNQIYGPYIYVDIDGTKHQAVFSTGKSGGISLPKQEIENLGLEKTSSAQYMTLTSEAGEKNIYTVPKMLIGNDVEVYDIECDEADVASANITVGMQSLRDTYNILISYSQEKLYLWDKNQLPKFLSKWTAVPIIDPNDIIVSGTIADSSYNFFLDTTGYFITQGKTYSYSLVNLEAFEKTTMATVPFQLGDRKFSFDFYDTESSNTNIPFDFFLGGLYFEHDVFIDFDGAMVYISK